MQKKSYVPLAKIRIYSEITSKRYKKFQRHEVHLLTVVGGGVYIRLKERGCARDGHILLKGFLLL
jgi:hypothetical protein